MILGFSTRATVGMHSRSPYLAPKLFDGIRTLTSYIIRECAIVAAGLQLRGEEVYRMLLQDFQRIGIAASSNVDGGAFLDDDVAACQQHIRAVGRSAQQDGVVFVVQEGQDFFARLKSECASAIAPAAGAFVVEGSWSFVFDYVMSHIKV
jgi:hypothetical protein